MTTALCCAPSPRSSLRCLRGRLNAFDEQLTSRNAPPKKRQGTVLGKVKQHAGLLWCVASRLVLPTCSPVLTSSLLDRSARTSTASLLLLLDTLLRFRLDLSTRSGRRTSAHRFLHLNKICSPPFALFSLFLSPVMQLRPATRPRPALPPPLLPTPPTKAPSKPFPRIPFPKRNGGMSDSGAGVKLEPTANSLSAPTHTFTCQYAGRPVAVVLRARPGQTGCFARLRDRLWRAV
jgi:hypothetical protein